MNTLYVLQHQYSPWADDNIYGRKSKLFRTLDGLNKVNIVDIYPEDIITGFEHPWVTECFLERYSITEFWNSFPESLQEEVRKGNGTILLSNYRCSHTFSAFWHLHSTLKEFGDDLPLDNMIYCVGSMSIARNWKEWKDRWEWERPHTLRILQYTCHETFNSFPVDVDKLKSYNPIESTNRDKLYTCLNHKIRDHRILTVAGLYERNIIDKGYVCFSVDDGTGNLFSHDPIESIKELVETKIDILQDIGLLVVNQLTSDNSYHRNPTIELCRSSYFSVVTQPEYFSQLDNMFQDTSSLTHTMLKPIINKQAFVVVGPCGYLQDLKEYGYATFDKWIDESYDNEVDDIKRLDMILDEIERLSKLSTKEWDLIVTEMSKILEENFTRLQYAETMQFLNINGLHTLLELADA